MRPDPIRLFAQRRWLAGLLVLILAVAGGRVADLRFEPQEEEAKVSEVAKEERGKRSVEKADGPIWTSSANQTARENAEAHWLKHRREFPEYRSAEEYIAGAHQFLRGPPAGTLFKSRSNGDRLLYDPESNTFAVQAKNGAPRTMFRPNKGRQYWSRQ